MNIIFSKPNKENLVTFVSLGCVLICISLLDVLLNTFIGFNLTGFLPSKLSYFAPIILGVTDNSNTAGLNDVLAPSDPVAWN